MIADPLRSVWPKEARGIRSAVWLLAALLDSRGENTSRPTAQNLFLAETPQSRPGWKRRRELEQAVIEKRESPLNTVSHRHPVSVRAEDIWREQHRHFEVRGL